MSGPSETLDTPETLDTDPVVIDTDPVVIDTDPVVIEDEPVVVRDGPGTTGAAADAVTDAATDEAFDAVFGAGPAVEEDLATVDPRMKRRWVDHRRHEGRRRLRILVGLGVFVLVAALAWVVAHSSLLGADTITVHGTDRLDPAAVRVAAHVDSGAPLLFLDEDAVARSVEQLPGIARATVHTELPDTVVIDVVERRPVAWASAPGPGPVALIDTQGRVFARVAVAPAGLLKLGGVTAGAVGTRVPHAAALRELGQLPVRLRLITDRSGLTADGAAILVLTKGSFGADRVVLGDGTATARKGTVALAVLDDLVARGEHRRVVDVSVPDAPLVH